MGERIDVGNTHSFHHAVFKINTKYHQHCKCACGANKEKISSYQSKTLHYTHIFPQGDDQNRKPNHKQHSTLLSQGWREGLHVPATPSPRLNWHPRGERSVHNYVPCSGLTRYSWTHSVCSPSASVYLSARWVNTFLAHFEIPEYEDICQNSSFQWDFEKTTGNNPKNIMTRASAIMFPVDFNRKLPCCSASGSACLPGTKGPGKKIRHFAPIPAVGLDLVTPLIPQRSFNLVVSSFGQGGHFREAAGWSPNSKWWLQSQI